MSSNLLSRATDAVTQNDLQYMVLDAEELPEALVGYQVVRENGMDNATLAEFGFATASEERFGKAGRIHGFVREFAPRPNARSAANIVVGTVAHLFESPEAVSGWMHEIFLHDFESNIGEDTGGGQMLLSVDRLDPKGFFDEAVAIKAVQSGIGDMVSSTVIDFRVGRILGVVYVGAPGDVEYLDLATEVGIALEKKIVGTVLRVS